MGGVLANNGDYTPWGKTSSESWDMNGKTWGYMAGGAIVGGISAGVGAAISASGGIMANTMGIMMSSAINSFGTTLYTGGQTDPSVSFGAGSYNFKKGTARGIWDWNDLSTMERIGYTAGALANTQDLVALFGSSTSYTVGSHVTKNDKTGHSYGYSQNVDDNIDISVASSKGWNPGGKTPGTTGHEARYLLQKFIPHKGRYFGSLRYHGKPGNSEITLYNVNKNILQNMTKRILGGLDPVSGGDLLYGFLNGCQSHVGRSLWAVGIPTLPINFHPYVLTLQLAIRQAAIQSSGILITR